MCGWTDLPADLGDHGALNRLSLALPDAAVVSSDLLRARSTADACGSSAQPITRRKIATVTVVTEADAAQAIRAAHARTICCR